MLSIKTHTENGRLILALEGRLDTTTAPQLEEALQGALGEDMEALVLDFSGLEYISSAGLRVLLAAQKRVRCAGGMTLVNVNEVVMEIFEVTGFVDILHIE